VSNWESQPGDSLSHHEIGKPNGQPRRWFFWTVRNESKGTPTRIVGDRERIEYQGRDPARSPRLSRSRADDRVVSRLSTGIISRGGEKGGWVGGGGGRGERRQECAYFRCAVMSFWRSSDARERFTGASSTRLESVSNPSYDDFRFLGDRDSRTVRVKRRRNA